ncbi:acyl-CoA dehydrogenase family protein [Kitasatospora sp. NBC_01287]|uniref:acyl-CoA dehydrogenase family protein n=1 Tax=Kitasatospora sp. NBC_01287 TaxID=2903573 RepID=UPI00224D4E1C|nr:acyl-CoA dehydrogenase family protein [Kitasatospora sp. NBC_01287]MCX4748426.1 acyl-CoA dehydrogenase family protein [Kitasatospora sp. NBC_01287]
MIEELTRKAAALELLLGDAEDPANPYGFAAAARRDEREEFPAAFAELLRSAGFHLDHLPAHWGGSFESFDRSLQLVRTAARRDLAVMPATMFSITAATCLRLHGSPEQQARAAELLCGGGAIGFALSEAAHGSDLLANEARLTPDGAGGQELNGTKWMVGLGQRCEALYLVARTVGRPSAQGAPLRGPGAFSALLLDLTAARPGRLERGAPVRTSGMRGIDFAHLTFDQFTTLEGEPVGRQGEALEVAVKAQQVVRLMSTAGSLGLADTGLRLTLDFAAERRTGRTTLLETPYQRRELALAATALLAADAVALAAARGIHVVPEQFSVWGCVAKHVVAESVEELLARCGATLATRSVLRGEGPGGGLFQKLQRDAALVRVVDTSTLANLRSFSGQLPTLTGAGADPAALRTVFALDAPLPPYDPTRLELAARGRDLVTATLADVAEPAAGELAEAGAPAVAALAEQLLAAVRQLPEQARAAGPGVELVDLAERFAWLHAAACCLHLWWANRHLPLFGGKPGHPGWLGAVLGYLLARAEGTAPRRAAGPAAPALDLVLGLREGHRLFSALPVPLAHPR